MTRMQRKCRRAAMMRGRVSAPAGGSAGGAAEMSRPTPPCGRNCPRRRAVPNCHNRDYCEAWGKYEDADAEWKAAELKSRMEERDIDGFYTASYRRYLRRIREQNDKG